MKKILQHFSPSVDVLIVGAGTEKILTAERQS